MAVDAEAVCYWHLYLLDGFTCYGRSQMAVLSRVKFFVGTSGALWV